MTDKELQEDKRQSVLGCAILLSIALAFVAVVVAAGIMFYKFLYL